jgi:flagellar assembly protein FliH
MVAKIERVSADAQIVGLGELLRPRPAALRGPDTEPESAPLVEPAQPDPRVLLDQERARVLDAARKEGYAAGMREAEKTIDARARASEAAWEEKFRKETERLAEAAKTLEGLAKTLPDALSKIERDAETLVVQATFEATTRLLANAAVDDALVLAYCREALAEYAMRPVVLRVHPGASAVVKSALSEADVRVEGDPRLAAGQCRVESMKGLYEISLEHRMDALKQELLAALGVRSEHSA